MMALRKNLFKSPSNAEGQQAEKANSGSLDSSSMYPIASMNKFDIYSGFFTALFRPVVLRDVLPSFDVFFTP